MDADLVSSSRIFSIKYQLVTYAYPETRLLVSGGGGGGGGLKNGPKHWQAKDCEGGLKRRRRVPSSIPQFVRGVLV